MRGTAFGIGVAALAGVIVPARGGEINNGFDTDVIYVLRAGTCESDVRTLDETMLDGPGPYVDGMDLGGLLPAKAVSTPYQDFNGSQDNSQIKSLCFSNSPVPGQHTPAGARLFGIYDVRSAEGPDGPIENEPPEHDWTNYSASFQIVELDQTGKRIRVMAVGLAASLFHDLPAPFDICNNHSPDMLIAPWCSNDQWGEGSRHNFEAGCRIGNIRYNPAKNTLMVAANVGEWRIFELNSPLTGQPAYPRGRIYEFELPDWPETYYESEAEVPFWCTNKAQMVGEPIPVSDPALVRLVQIYEMPNPHSVSANNGQLRNDNARPAIDVDDEGNVYFTSRFFNATTPPCFNNNRWEGDCTGPDGDVVKCSTLGRYGGRNVYVIPITGPDAGNLIIRTVNQAALGHTEYDGGHGIAVRPMGAVKQLVTVPRQAGCNDPLASPIFLYVNVFDLNQTEPGYAHELLRIKYLGDYSDVSGCDGVPPDPGCPQFLATRCDIPRTPYFAQRDADSNRIFMANLAGACDCPQNFMCLQPNDVVAHDLGYHLTSSCIEADCTGHYEQGVGCELRTDWDAASPPPTPVDVPGACCTDCSTCQEMTHAECDAAGGFYQGTNTTCGQYPCPGQGACCTACTGECEVLCESECTGWDQTWHGDGTTCDVACDICSPQPMDADCDQDVDQDDFGMFQLCYTGQGGTLPADPAVCACFDTDGDNDIDTFDFNVFELCGSGPTVPGSETCAD